MDMYQKRKIRKENKKNNKNKEKEGQARERCYGSCFWFVLFCDFLKTVKNIEKQQDMCYNLISASRQQSAQARGPE